MVKKERISWNKGLTKETDERVKKMSESLKGRKLSEEHKRKIGEGGKGRIVSEETRKKMSVIMKGKNNPMCGVHLYGKDNPFYGKKHSKETLKKISKSLTGKNNPMYGKHHSEETKKKIRDAVIGRKMSEETKRKISEANKGHKVSEETRKKLSERQIGEKNHMYGKHPSEETRKKMSDAIQKRKERDGYIHSSETRKKLSEAMQKRKEVLGYINSPETRKKISEKAKTRIGEKNPFYGKHHTEETLKKISGENHYKWNPNRSEVYAPYGENFYNKNIRNRKWNLQNSRDMLTGTLLDINKKPAYHHIDYDKSNDDTDNHCFVSVNNHMRITAYQKNPIKSERYKKILQENTLALKNGEIPKNWSPLNKELFRQEKLKQLDLSSYII